MRRYGILWVICGVAVAYLIGLVVLQQMADRPIPGHSLQSMYGSATPGDKALAAQKQGSGPVENDGLAHGRR